jgi:hypothetical protein
MIISDLNHLETVEGTAIVGGGGFIINNFKDEVIKVDELVKIDKDLFVNVDIKGNFADAQADAQAFGEDTDAQTIAATVVAEDLYSISTTRSIAAAA